jgi:hypothetical protein
MNEIGKNEIISLNILRCKSSQGIKRFTVDAQQKPRREHSTNTVQKHVEKTIWMEQEQ